jgi:hypothetical protein
MNEINKKMSEMKINKYIFKEIVIGGSFAYGLDENHDLYSFNMQEMKLFKSKVKNMFGSYDGIFGIDLDGLTFRIKESKEDHKQSVVYLDTNLKFEKITSFGRWGGGNDIFANTIDGHTYSWMDDYYHPGLNYYLNESPTKFDYDLKKIVQIIFDNGPVSDFSNDMIYVKIAIGSDGKFYGFPDDRGGFCVGDTIDELKKRLFKMYNERIEHVESFFKMIDESLFGKEFTIDCSGKKIDVKMIYDYYHLKMASDKSGRVYFSERDAYRYFYHAEIKNMDKKWSDRYFRDENKYKFDENHVWIESPYVIKP